jgi:hypothetical protein
MKAFEYFRAGTPADSSAAVATHHNAMFFAGGTTLVDLMKIDVLTPDTLVDVNQLALREIDVVGEAIVVGANVSNSQLAWHRPYGSASPWLRNRSFPALRHRSATWRPSLETSFSVRVAPIFATSNPHAIDECRILDAMHSTASTADMRYLA